ncbi:hypothetical protein D3C75_487930 [compost metagenome]
MTINNKVVQVKLELANNLYCFMNTDKTIAIGDIVVCDTARGLSVGNVVAFTEEGSYKQKRATKYIIQKVNMADHFLRLEQAKRVKEIEATLEAKKKEFVDTRLLDLVIEQNPSLGALVAELNALKKGV